MAGSGAGQLAAENRIEALRHRLRARIMRLLITEGPGSPSKMAKALEAPLDSVNYHTKRLVELNCAELVGEEKASGSIEHIYRATERYLVETEEWEGLDPALKDLLSAEFAQAHIDDLVLAFRAGTLGTHKHFNLCQKRIVVDARGRDEVMAIQERAMEEIQKAETQAMERRSSSKDPGISMSVLQGCFEVPPPD